MKRKILIFMFLLTFSSIATFSQTEPISAKTMAVYTVQPSTDTLSPYYPYPGIDSQIGVRRVIVGDANGDGTQEILATDYINGGRVHVMHVNQDSTMEIIWSSPAATSSSGSTPRWIAIGDCDGDGNKEIIFEQANYDNNDGGANGRICIYEWDGVSSWGDAPAFTITPSKLTAAGGRESERFTREVLTVYDFDGDGKTEIVPHGDDPRQDVLILSVTGSYSTGNPGFSSIKIEGGKPGTQTNGGDWGAGGSFWNAEPCDINGDGKLEIVNHVYNNYGFWSIEVEGKDTYTYPQATDNADAKAKGVYHEYLPTDGVSYFGARAVDVDGDGKDEIVGTQYGNSHNVAMISFPKGASPTNCWTNESQDSNYAIIVQSKDIAALAGKSAVELWPIVKGDLNKDGKDELYTGGATGLNLVAIQYNGKGSVLDPQSYDYNLVYAGKGAEGFHYWNVYNGKVTYRTDTLYAGTDTMQVVQTPIGFDPSVIDTVKEESPFTSYIYADSVDLDNDGNLEIVLAQQSVYDSTSINVYDWVDTSGVGQWILNLDESHKIYNPYRQPVRVLEYSGQTTGLVERDYNVVTPDDYKLEHNYPNPFNPTTNIEFTLPLDKKISLKIYDMLGQEVKTLIDSQQLKKGNHQVIWDGTNNYGSKVSSGNYLAKLTFGNFAKTIKMTLLK